MQHTQTSFVTSYHIPHESKTEICIVILDFGVQSSVTSAENLCLFLKCQKSHPNQWPHLLSVTKVSLDAQSLKHVFWPGGEKKHRGEILCLFPWQASVPPRDAPHRLRNAGVSHPHFWTSFLGNISSVSEKWSTNKHSGWMIVFMQPHWVKRFVSMKYRLRDKKEIYKQFIQTKCLLTCLSEFLQLFF